jgi:1,4-alpha-glucan branching enzyme
MSLKVSEVSNERDQIELLKTGRHADPHSFLGLHKTEEGEEVIRFWLPYFSKCIFEFKGEMVEASPSSDEGFFTYFVPKGTKYSDYQVMHPDGKMARDPYSFSSTFSLLDGHRFSEGVHYDIYNVLGAHMTIHENVLGVKFAVFAPNATRVSVIGDFNKWRDFHHPMRKVGNFGIWELFIPGISEGSKYKYSIRTRSGNQVIKIDPFANHFELRPCNASIVSASVDFHWCDGDWMKKRARTSALNGPMNIYEMHIGSWIKKKEGFYNYRELAAEIVPYLKEMGYTHLEIMPITEHPLDESWGYQSTGYFAPTSRFGNMIDFQYFVNHLHMHHIGIIMDWAPGHFPVNKCALSEFDGEAVYEKNCSVMGIHPEWNTHIPNFGRKEVTNFFIASALFWLDKMHIDAIRVDGVQSMLYLDYARWGREWHPNREGGNVNFEAVAFIKHLNSIIHEKYPGVLMIAEDASMLKGITNPMQWGGLGFDLKWNLGWMNNTLEFIERDPIHRKYHMDELLNGFKRAFEERFVLPISHDEVVYGKKSLIAKMPGDEWSQMSHLKLYYSFAICHPGKNLFFMGTEFGQKWEWNCQESIHWHLLENHFHIKLKKFVREMNHFYLKTPALWEIDFDQKGFSWIDHDNHDYSIISYLRRGITQTIACVHNFTPTEFPEYIIRLSSVKSATEIFNTDDYKYAGGCRTNPHIHILEDKSGFVVKMPPLATMIFAIEFT